MITVTPGRPGSSVCRQVLCLAALATWLVASAAAEPSRASEPPRHAVDPYWPQRLPNGWRIGQVAGVAVDKQDHVWVLQRPGSLTDDERAAALDPPAAKCCAPAPPVLEFDSAGRLVRSWGPASGAPWVKVEHGIHVDDEGFVWISGSDPTDGVLLKFDRDGRFVLRIGEQGRTGIANSNDVTRLGGPAGIVVDTRAQEVFVADGYFNRRVIVFDAVTGAYKRHWGAYGRRPGTGDRSQLASFTVVHCIARSQGGLLYVCDRANNRVQVFRPDGSFVREFFVEPATLGIGSVWAIAVWSHGGSEYLINADGTNNEVRILDPETGGVVDTIGHPGRMAGEFHWVHGVAVDSRGALYTAEVHTGKRLQRFAIVPD